MDQDRTLTDLLTRDEAARRAGVHYNTIRLWERTGRLQPQRVRVGFRWEIRITAADLERAMEERSSSEVVDWEPRPHMPGGRPPAPAAQTATLDGSSGASSVPDGAPIPVPEPEVEPVTVDDGVAVDGPMLLAPDRLWAMYQEAIDDARKQAERASSLDAENRALREQLAMEQAERRRMQGENMWRPGMPRPDDPPQKKRSRR